MGTPARLPQNNPHSALVSLRDASRRTKCCLKSLDCLCVGVEHAMYRSFSRLPWELLLASLGVCFCTALCNVCVGVVCGFVEDLCRIGEGSAFVWDVYGVCVGLLRSLLH